VYGSKTNGLRFLGNDYYTNGGPFEVVWGGTPYQCLADWRAGTNNYQETLHDGTPVGMVEDPQLADTGSGYQIDNPGDPSYIDMLGSLLAPYYESHAPVAGIDLPKLQLVPAWDPYQMNLGLPTDFYGQTTFTWGGTDDPHAVGAYQFAS
jgi:hypothetical protein